MFFYSSKRCPISVDSAWVRRCLLSGADLWAGAELAYAPYREYGIFSGHICCLSLAKGVHRQSGMCWRAASPVGMLNFFHLVALEMRSKKKKVIKLRLPIRKSWIRHCRWRPTARPRWSFSVRFFLIIACTKEHISSTLQQLFWQTNTVYQQTVNSSRQW